MTIQQKWRWVGIVSLGLSFLLALGARSIVRPGTSLVLLIAYFVLFSALLILSILIAFLDIKFTHLKYKLAEKELFHQMFLPDGSNQISSALHQNEGKSIQEEKE